MLFGISYRFQQLSQTQRQVTHVLLTRPPLEGKSKSEIVQALKLQWAFSYDLHVLGMPPAFILSQDQTLKNIFQFVLFVFLATQIILTFCSVFKDHFNLFFCKGFLHSFVKCVLNIPHTDTYVNNFFEIFSFFLFFFQKNVFLTIL